MTKDGQSYAILLKIIIFSVNFYIRRKIRGIIMTELFLKKLLQEFLVMQEKETLLRHYSEFLSLPEVKTQELEIRVLKSAMSILTEKELFIIKNHLILHNTWPETHDLYEERYGRENSYSDRTLKRIQNKALKRMVNFINSLSIINLIYDK